MELKKWHSTDTKDVLEILKSNEEGLTNEEALARLKKYGKNKVVFDMSVSTDFYKAIIYYISGMTDNFAIEIYNEIIHF